ncbi:unnamed protein product [Cylicocyclus nassatus]|uniref:Uncharacterized protein n=1 Tax=Cylicocyclus nassatus TaxID=53992 RepID=A0AA36GIC0_CYLNA|nr:unnamed protein product [Cylicocyclus nassatus]
MGPSLKPHKTRITKVENTLEELIESSQHMVAFEIPITENEEESMDLLRTRIKSIQHRHTNITTTKAALETAVSSYQEAFSSLDNNSQQEERTSQETYVDRAWDLTATALSLLNKLDEKETESSRLDNFAQAARRRERQLEAVNTPQASNESSRWTTPPPSAQLQSMLPRLQLPKFSGRREEWGFSLGMSRNILSVGHVFVAYCQSYQFQRPRQNQTTIECRYMAEELTELRETAGLISSRGVWPAQICRNLHAYLGSSLFVFG